jgi:hypothetical protein
LRQPIAGLTLATMNGPDPATPLLVIGSVENVKLRRNLAIGTGLCWLTYYATRLAGDFHVQVPWMPSMDATRLAALVVVMVALVLARRYAKQRTGAARFYPDRVEVEKKVRGSVERAVAALADLEGYRDESAEFVQLVKKGERLASPLLAVPTSSEAERLQVLEYLDAHGIRRLDA